MTALPKPESSTLEKIVKHKMSRAIYGVLYENRNQALPISKIRKRIGLKAGQQEHLNRRLRDLYPFFKITRTRQGRDTLYLLVSVSDKPHQASGNISNKTRSWVLRDQRCAQCGRTPLEDKVKLHVDHIIPQEWNGTDDRENLQPLCSECNEGKKNLFSSYNEFTDKIKQAVNYDEPHKRIGELLKAFNKEPVPSELLELVAKAKQYQDDWQKRLRELRVLGWDYSFKKKKEGRRVRSFFKLIKYEPWPEGSIAAEIRKCERQKSYRPSGCRICRQSAVHSAELLSLQSRNNRFANR
ncbi:MAG: HNH endonuclease [Candidatus Peribacteraceae bacterium]|nr:HNH endonuclease [Candidatus Peribacteraceae bacterium]